MAEWEAMFADAVSGGCSSPAITDDTGNGCWGALCIVQGNCSFSGVLSEFYWSGTTETGFVTSAWFGGLTWGDVGIDGKAGDNNLWPVRGRQ